MEGFREPETVHSNSQTARSFGQKTGKQFRVYRVELSRNGLAGDIRRPIYIQRYVPAPISFDTFNVHRPAFNLDHRVNCIVCLTSSFVVFVLRQVRKRWVKVSRHPGPERVLRHKLFSAGARIQITHYCYHVRPAMWRAQHPRFGCIRAQRGTETRGAMASESSGPRVRATSKS
jgi:hypothetical protein